MVANDSFAAFIDDQGWEDDFWKEGQKEVSMHKNQELFSCVYCGGSGNWVSPFRMTERECFACKGKGKMPMNAQQQRERREANKNKAAKARQTREKNESANRCENSKIDNGELLIQLGGMIEWNEFAASLIDQHNQGRIWSEKQIVAAQQMVAKVLQNREQKKKDNSVNVDLSPIKQMFDAAVNSGYKRPKYRAEGLILSRAPDSGKNAGSLYVKNEDGDYMGKIVDGTDFQGKKEAVEALNEIAKDPKAAAMRWGQKTGKCSCCGLTLTNKNSIEAGIGPICESKWGL